MKKLLTVLILGAALMVFFGNVLAEEKALLGDYKAKNPEEEKITVSSDGVISDSVTSLEWVVGPDRDTNYAQARQWVASCKTAGGGWRMPTRKELRALYQKGVGKHNMDLAFKTTGWHIWAEPRDSSSAWALDFHYGDDYWSTRFSSFYRRGFAVRSRR